MEKEEKKKKEENFLLCESIGHRPLRGRCPKTGVEAVAAAAAVAVAA